MHVPPAFIVSKALSSIGWLLRSGAPTGGLSGIVYGQNDAVLKKSPLPLGVTRVDSLRHNSAARAAEAFFGIFGYRRAAG